MMCFVDWYVMFVLLVYEFGCIDRIMVCGMGGTGSECFKSPRRNDSVCFLRYRCYVDVGYLWLGLRCD